MKLFMYTSLLLLGNFIKVVISEYNILRDVKDISLGAFEFADGSDGYDAYKFRDTSSVNASISDTSLSEVKLSPPFVINAMFKFDVIVYSCLFAIIDSKEQVKLRLCLTADDEKSFSVFFDGIGDIGINASFNVDDLSSWHDLFLIVKKDTIEIYIKCEEKDSYTLAKKMEDIDFSDDSTIYIGQSGTEKRDPFNGNIQKVVIYPEMDNVKTICKDFKETVVGEKGDQGSPGTKGERGDKGEKGDKGDSIKGKKGDEGPLGPTGPIGSRGLSGEKGICQCSETMVSALLKAMPEMKGPQGNPGPSGADGVIGPIGEVGPPGRKGDIGEKGEMGLNGINGKDGPPGSKGEPGRDGHDGSPGIPGLPCKGEQGIKGEKGDKGVTGLPGVKSEPGVPGTHGKDGKKGDKGDTGQKGETGMPAKLSSILKDDLDPVEKSMVIEKLRGYKGDQGDKGDIGAKGDMGLSGIPGKDGTKGQLGSQGPIGPQGEKGNVGTLGPKGVKGEPGKNGPPGIVPTSVLKNMKGSKGDQGKAGTNGPRGNTGSKGQRGPSGPRGPKGPKGDMGAAGKMGTAGPPGDRGQKGEKGDMPVIDLEKVKGEKGERGPEGMPGKPGEAGPPGVCQKVVASEPVAGPPGSPGSRGPPGPSGPAGNPGLSFYGPKGEPGGIIRTKTLYNFGINSVDPDDEDVVYTTETLIYRTSRSLIKRTKLTALGTLAYVLEEKLLLLRVEDGWQRVMMGPLFTDGLWTSKDISSNVEENVYLQKRKRKITAPLKEDIKQKPKYSIRLVALDKPFSGKMETATNRSGRKTVDHECHVQSQKAKIAGTFTAFLSNRVEDLKYIPKTLNKEVKVVNIKGETLFDSWSEIFGNGGNSTIKGNIYSFGLKDILEDPTWGIKAIWSGSNSLGIRNNGSFCLEWQSDNPNHTGMAINVYHKKMVADKQYSCDKKLIVLCVEVIGRKKRHTSSRWRRSYSHLGTDQIGD